jgi:hypothetical protein
MSWGLKTSPDAYQIVAAVQGACELCGQATGILWVGPTSTAVRNGRTVDVIGDTGRLDINRADIDRGDVVGVSVLHAAQQPFRSFGELADHARYDSRLVLWRNVREVGNGTPPPAASRRSDRWGS